MKNFLVIIALLFICIPYASANDLCSGDLEKLPILSNGRVKPLQVHAKEALKFMTGKSKPLDASSAQTYCQLSLSSFLPQDQQTQLNLKVSHEESKNLLGLDAKAKQVSPDVVAEKMRSLNSFVHNLEKTGQKKSVADDLQQLMHRYNLYSSIKHGLDWNMPPSDKKGDTNLLEQTWPNIQQLIKSNEKYKDPSVLMTKIKEAGNTYAAINSDYLVELTYDKLKLFHWAMLLTIFGLAAAFGFRKVKHPVTLIFVGLIFAFEISAAIFRMIIGGRAPVTNMYETVMCVGIGGLLFAFILALYRKERLYLIMGLIINLIALFMMNFASSMFDATIKPLMPVLRDNFWLATHVTSITISYAALALSWFVAIYFMVKSCFTIVDKAELKKLNTFAYDCIKIGVVLLAAGIILGAVWADYSWGRFWGWDPKETWSLIALLAYMIVLHGRYAGWINTKTFMPITGLAFNSILMAWFGVNYILASGLHSYGFSSGGALFLAIVVLIQAIIFAMFFVKTRFFKR
ncbi:MAG: cytochrome c biogenesis protein CcsA [bacterium]|nr:cytochrome c biogenesis protein CcsA [bacterium]MBU1919177.1 cytochrome c biogenesis protein CcsA [bacterium]